MRLFSQWVFISKIMSVGVAKRYLWCFCCVLSLGVSAQNALYSWRTYLSYGSVQQVVNTPSEIYALSNGALFSVDKRDKTISYYTKLTGLTGDKVACMAYDSTRTQLVLAYEDGKIDFLQDDGSIISLWDLFSANFSFSKQPRQIVLHNHSAFLAMPFGILEISLPKHEITNTFYVGDDASYVDLQSITSLKDTLYALANSGTIYKCAFSDNMLDYHFWQQDKSFENQSVRALSMAKNTLFLLKDSVLYGWQPSWNTWEQLHDLTWDNLQSEKNGLYLFKKGDVFALENNAIVPFISELNARCLAMDNRSASAYVGTAGSGVVRYENKRRETFFPNGPISNYPFRVRCAENRVFVASGGYSSSFAVSNNSAGSFGIYENGWWRNYGQGYFMSRTGLYTEDFVDIIADPSNASHFFIATFGYGLIEMRNNEFYARYSCDNSPLTYIANFCEKYTWTDGLAWDKNRNLWMLNPGTSAGVKVLKKNGSWASFSNVATNNLDRARDLVVWKNNEQIKVLACTRSCTGIGVFDDAGTLDDESDDQAVFHTSFIDQDNKILSFQTIPCLVQDKNGVIWVGTDAGLFTVTNAQNMLRSNACQRIKISRDDDSGLADYLLNNERINTIAIDGANRKWIGTEASGVYLVSEDGTQTIYHFTPANSPLPSMRIVSIGINPISGDVFMGTDMGLVSYRDDVSEGQGSFSHITVSPNPVYPSYQGTIVINGLMENSTVYVVDASGSMVYKTTSKGGTAIWNGRLPNGKRVSSGVYMIFANPENGSKSGSIRLLIL